MIERLLRVHVWAVYAFMYLPVALLALFSLNSAEIMAFPLERLTLDWYAQVVADRRLLGGLATTFMVALPVTLITTLLGAMAALALTRHRFRYKPALVALLVVPFFIPKVVFAIAEAIALAALGIPKSLATVWVAQSLVILPFVTVIIASVLWRLDPRLEEAAADLGAGAFTTFRRVTLPLMKNGLMAGAFVGFVLSSAEYTVSFFTSGRAQPLSVLVASDFRFDLSPKLNALAMLIVLFNVAVIGISELLRRRPAERRVGAAGAAGS